MADLSKWFEALASESASDARLAQWRVNYDEARVIARYFQWIAERKSIPRRSQPPRREEER
ncbi:MAG: hypothetical protein E6I84_08775 [Chloroflexi bacterium]|nr:MAG: hypothetical protein E6I84_08775 [Chloroflexota bacterium]